MLYVVPIFSYVLAYNYLCSSRPRCRFVTVEGERGVGKTAFVSQLARHITERNAYDEICFIPCSRMQRDYEASTRNDYSLQMAYLIHEFTVSLSRYNGKDVSCIEDLISYLNARESTQSNSSNCSRTLSSLSTYTDSGRHSTDSLDYHMPQTTSIDHLVNMRIRGSVSHQSSLNDLANNKPNVTFSPSHGSSEGGILYVLDGCDDFLKPSVSSVQPIDRPIQTDSANHFIDVDESQAPGEAGQGELTPLLSIVDAILRRTTHVNFLVTRGKVQTFCKTDLEGTDVKGVVGIAHIMEPEKVISLKAFSGIKMAELIRKVAPRPFSLAELGLSPATMSHANDALSKKPWLVELKGNPRVRIKI